VAKYIVVVVVVVVVAVVVVVVVVVVDLELFSSQMVSLLKLFTFACRMTAT